MFDDDDEYFDRDPFPSSPVWHAIAVLFWAVVVAALFAW